MDASSASSPLPAQRLQQLQHLFEQIASTRMAGLPILHPALQVEVLGFEPLPLDALPQEQAAPAGLQAQPELLGILITPWFMNLLCLPLRPCLRTSALAAKRELLLGAQRFEFLAHAEAGLGTFWACSLFSPMSEFVDQAQARETAVAVLQALRVKPVPAAHAAPANQPVGNSAASADAVVASRRALLFGRSAVTSAAGRS